jgi:hypothetical protein
MLFARKKFDSASRTHVVLLHWLMRLFFDSVKVGRTREVRVQETAAQDIYEHPLVVSVKCVAAIFFFLGSLEKLGEDGGQSNPKSLEGA